jgi:DNA-binding NarL/FixJ family response regulator
LRVFLADDHEVMREGLRLLVNSQPDMEVVGEAADGQAAFAGVNGMRPDVAVVDISMPGLNGLQVAERLRRVCPQVKVVTLTRHADGSFLQQLLRAGVGGYVLKQSASDVLLSAVRAVASGQTFLDPAITEKVVGSYVERRLIALGHSNKEIAAQMEVSVKTVEAHKANAMQKLGMKGRTDIVSYAILRGWLQNN